MPETIRKMGPLIHMSTMRFESKHKFFKEHIKHIHNFKNVLLSISTKHQQWLSRKENTFMDRLTYGAPYPIVMKKSKNKKSKKCNSSSNKKKSHELTDEELKLITSYFVNIQTVQQTSWLEFNNYRYEEDFIIIHESSIYKICKILLVNDAIYLFLVRFAVVELHTFSNSYKIKKSCPTEYKFITFKSLSCKRPHEYKTIEEEMYLKENTLELKINNVVE